MTRAAATRGPAPGESSLRVKFWGVRGSIPTPLPTHMGYGGNTSCVELRSSDGTICILDAGSGARVAGQAMLAELGERLPTINVFLSHYHWDHIQGIPFFAPLYGAQHRVEFRAAGQLGRVRDLLWGQMVKPYFPVNLGDLLATHSFAEMDTAPVTVGQITVHPFALHHPQGCYGFRVECGGKVFVYASDHEPGDAAADRRLREFAESADVLVCDSQYTPEEYDQRRGWGHGTWLESTRVARDANAGQLVLFHHDPDHDDAFVRRNTLVARREFENTFSAQEGFTIEL
ncbi:MAG: MBL fold metallo-hydrolase [Bryobacteraceae bacterium]